MQGGLPPGPGSGPIGHPPQMGQQMMHQQGQQFPFPHNPMAGHGM